MNNSENLGNISAALLVAQKAIESAKKGAVNDAFKRNGKGSSYADINAVIEAVKKPLNDAGIVFLQPVTCHEGRVVVKTVLLHESGEWIESEGLELPLEKQTSHAVGSAVSYGRRYSLQSMLGLQAEDDDGNTATAAQNESSDRPQVQRKSKQIESEEDIQRKRLFSLVGGFDEDQKQKFGDEMKRIGYASLAKIPTDKVSEAITFAEGL